VSADFPRSYALATASRSSGPAPAARSKRLACASSWWCCSDIGPKHENASVFPTEVSEGVVVAFAVDDIVGAREELAAAKVELIGELVWANELFENPTMEGFGWFFFRGPDGNVYVMQQDSRPDAT
jgi:hypothetical protein